MDRFCWQLHSGCCGATVEYEASVGTELTIGAGDSITGAGVSIGNS